MTFQLFYGDAVCISNRDRHVDERVRNKRFSTEQEALNRARELLDADFSTVVAIRDAAGNQLSGVRLQLRLGYSCIE